MAEGDPFKAEAIEERITPYWFYRWAMWRNAKAETEARANGKLVVPDEPEE